MEKKIAVQHLLESLTMLPISFRLEYEAAIQKLLPDIEGKKTIPELFLRLSPLFTFIDYNLLKYLVSEFGSEELRRKMSIYVDEIQTFMKKTTVGELMQHFPGAEIHPEHFSKLWTKIHDDPRTYTLEKLNHLRRNLCSALRLSEVLFNLVRIEASRSFFIGWLIPIEKISEVAQQVIGMDTFFKRNNILMVVVDEKLMYYFISSDDEKLKKWVISQVSNQCH